MECSPQGESPPVFKREKNMETDSGPDEERNVVSTAGFDQGGKKAQRRVRVWGDRGPYSETDAWRVHHTFKKLQHPKEEPLWSYSTNQDTQAYGG